MEIVRIFSNTPKYTLQRKKLLSKHGISVPSRNLSLHSRIQGWMGVCTDYGRIYRAKTVVLSVKDLRSLCTRSRGTFEGRNLADRDINPVSEHRERERDAGGNYARYIFPPSRVIGIPEAHASHAPRAALTTFVSGRGWSVLRRRVPSSLCRCRWGVWRRDNETRSIQLDFK